MSGQQCLKQIICRAEEDLAAMIENRDYLTPDEQQKLERLGKWLEEMRMELAARADADEVDDD